MDQLDLKYAVLVGHSTGGRRSDELYRAAIERTQFVKSLVRSGFRMWRQLPITEE